MSIRILTITLLLVLMFCQSSARKTKHNLRGPVKFHRPPPCCTKYYKADVRDDVIGETYREQAANPPCVRAFIFSIAEGKVCVDPNEEWAQNITAYLTKE